MALNRSKSRYAIKECSTCGSLYTKDCCSIGSLNDKILVPEPDPSPCCARCGTPVDGPSCRGCAFLRKKFDEDLLAYCVENGIFKDFQNTSESSNDNTNVVNAPREPSVVNQDPGVKSSQDPPQIDHNCCYECGDSLDGIFCRQCICKSCGKGAHYGYNCPPKDPIISKPEPCNQTINEIPQTLPSLDPSCYSLPHVSKPNFVDNSPNFSYPPPQPQFETYLCELCGNNAHYGYDCSPQFSFDSVDCQEALDKILKELEELKRDQRMLKELKKRIAKEQTAKENMSIEEMRHEEQLIDYKIKEIINDLGYKRFRGEEIDEEYERDYYLKKFSSKEPDNSLNMVDEHLDTILAKESDEVIKSSVENLVPIPNELEGMSDDTSNVPTCDNNCVNVESDFVESLINRDTSIVHSSKIDPILEEFAGELAHIAPIPPGIVEADFDPNDDISSDDDDFEDIEYVSFEEVNDFEQEEKEFDLEDILQIQDVILRERLLKISCLITNIESLKDNPTPIPVTDSDSSDTSLSHLDNSLPEFETFSDHTEETRSGSTTTHANYSLPEYDSFLFEIEPDQEGLISIDNSNNTLLELPEFESFHFYPPFPRPPPEPPDVEICLYFEPDVPVIDNFNELNDDQRGSEIDFSQNIKDDDSFTFVIRTFLPFLIYPEVSPLSCSTGSEDTIFDPVLVWGEESIDLILPAAVVLTFDGIPSPRTRPRKGIEKTIKEAKTINTDKKREKDKESRARMRNQPEITAESARYSRKVSQRKKQRSLKKPYE
ncbi:hypothetical protein Tco_0885094 [Tanacetum coccineum]